MRRPDPDTTLIGFAPGATIGLSGIGAASLALAAIETHLGAPAGSLMAGDYYYPGLAGSSRRARAYGSAATPNAHAAGRLMVWGGYLYSAAGAPNPPAVWAAFAKEMLAAGCADDYLRAGHEGDGNWFPGAAGRIGDKAYGDGVTAAVTAVKTAGWSPGIEVNFDTYAAGKNGLDVEKMLPPHGLFDLIGLDVYDYAWGGLNAQDHAAVWSGAILPRLEATRALADKHGVRWAVSETGQCIATDGHGGGDSRYFIDNLAAYAQKYLPAYLHLFLGSDRTAAGVVTRTQSVFIPAPDGTSYTDNPAFPVAAKAYRQDLQPASFIHAAPADPPTTQLAQLVAQVADLTAQLNTATTKLHDALAELAAAQAEVTTQAAQLDADEAEQFADATALAKAEGLVTDLRDALEAILSTTDTPPAPA